MPEEDIPEASLEDLPLEDLKQIAEDKDIDVDDKSKDEIVNILNDETSDDLEETKNFDVFTDDVEDEDEKDGK